jgi:hypothetical protein
MSGGVVSGNSVSSSSSHFNSPDRSYGGGVSISGGTFTMSGGIVSGNTASSSASSASANSYGGGVSVSGGTFNMSGGAVSGNKISGGNTYGREVLVDGTFKISGYAWPERVFLSGSTNFITISGPLSGGTNVPIDLGITGSNPLTGLLSKPVLALDSSYLSGDLASLKAHFTLGNATLTESPYTKTPIPANYTISSDGKLEFPISGIVYSPVSGGTWTLESDGRRKSPSTGDSGVTKMRVSFTSVEPNANIRIDSA